MCYTSEVAAVTYKRETDGTCVILTERKVKDRVMEVLSFLEQENLLGNPWQALSWVLGRLMTFVRAVNYKIEIGLVDLRHFPLASIKFRLDQ